MLFLYQHCGCLIAFWIWLLPQLRPLHCPEGAVFADRASPPPETATARFPVRLWGASWVDLPSASHEGAGGGQGWVTLSSILISAPPHCLTGLLLEPGAGWDPRGCLCAGDFPESCIPCSAAAGPGRLQCAQSSVQGAGCALSSCTMVAQQVQKSPYGPFLAPMGLFPFFAFPCCIL